MNSFIRRRPFVTVAALVALAGVGLSLAAVESQAKPATVPVTVQANPAAGTPVDPDHPAPPKRGDECTTPSRPFPAATKCWRIPENHPSVAFAVHGVPGNHGSTVDVTIRNEFDGLRRSFKITKQVPEVAVPMRPGDVLQIDRTTVFHSTLRVVAIEPYDAAAWPAAQNPAERPVLSGNEGAH